MQVVRRWTLALPLAMIAATAAGQQPAHFELGPETVLMDEPFHIAVVGLAPNQEITIRAEGGGIWHSSAAFRADAKGRVEVADPMTFVWSATGERPPAGADGDAQPWVFTAEAGGHVLATGTIVRRAVAADVRVVPVRERGLVGVAYYPAAPGRLPAVIVMQGSSGGVPGPATFVGGLASRGYVVLALAYFNAEGLPPLLHNVPLEYFATAVDWLKANPSVDPARIGIVGTSRGAELALLLGTTYPETFRVVVANLPSSVVWPGLSDDTDTPAWTLKGQPLAAMPIHFGPEDHALIGRERFLKRMTDPAVVAKAAIPVERIGGAVLLFSGKDDLIWPSDVFASQIVERLKAHDFQHPVEHHSFEKAGHAIGRPAVPTSDVRQVRPHPVSKRPNMMGGTPEGQARANADSWEKLLAFLDRYLRH